MDVEPQTAEDENVFKRNGKCFILLDKKSEQIPVNGMPDSVLEFLAKNPNRLFDVEFEISAYDRTTAANKHPVGCLDITMKAVVVEVKNGKII